jgi:O-antigen/teichoic acid export membrane protein
MKLSASRPAFHVADGTIRAFLAEALLLPTGFITMMYLMRRLGPAGYGLFALSISLFAWVAIGATNLFSRAAIKFVSEAEDWRAVGATVLRLHLAAGLISALLIWFLAIPTANLLSEPRLRFYLRLFTIELVVYSLVEAHRTILIGIGRFRKRALISALRWPARLLLIIAFVQMGLSVSGAILGSLGATSIELVLYRLYVRPGFSNPSRFPATKLFGYALPLFFFGLSMRLFERLDLFALKALGSTATDVGFYAAAQNLAMVPGLFAAVFSPFLLSTLGRLRKSAQERAACKMSRDAMRVVFGMLPFAGLVAGAASEIVGLLLGQRYAATAPILALLFFSGVAMVMIAIATVMMIAADRLRGPFMLSCPMLLLSLGADILLIPRFGAIGAATVTTGFAALGAVASTTAACVWCGIAPPLATGLRGLILCILAYAAASLWPASGLLLIPKLALLSALILLGFRLLGEFSAGESASLRSLCHPRALFGIYR